MATLQDIVAEVDRRAAGRPLGELQAFRKAARGMERQFKRVFGSLKADTYTFHRGGREELQFNLGFEDEPGRYIFRYGIAFSLEPSRSLPDIDPLVRKIALFNDYLRQNPEDFADLWMWEYAPERNPDHRPVPVEERFARLGSFIFLGGYSDPETIDFDAVMETLDRLMPLYRFVEAGQPEAVPITTKSWPALRPGCPPRPVQTTATLAERLLNVILRHNALLTQLHAELAREYGENHVGVEQPAPGSGGRIDMLVETDAVRIVFEIKTAMTARGCIREAMGQLLDYGCWPGSRPTDRLVVVGEAELTSEAAAYLQDLNRRFPKPIEYRSVALAEA